MILGGCCGPKPVATTQPYTGPTDPMRTVISAINDNNEKIPSLWTELNYSATLVDPEKKTTDTVGGSGGLMYARDRNLLLHGDKDIAGRVFEMGSNDLEFWLRIRADANSFNYWWGHYANLGKPGCRPIPIRPDLVVEVLGVGTYSPDFLRQPVPVMRFDNERDAYVFDLNERTGGVGGGGDRWVTVEEVWYARATKLPIRVMLYDDNGRAEVIADLSNHKPVESAGVPREQWPKVAGHYELFFPDNQSRISFDFPDDPEVQHVNPRTHIPLPNANSFERVEPDANDKVIQIDKDCAPPSAAMR